MKRVLLSGAILAAVGVFVFLTTGASRSSAAGTYKIEFDNAFGLVTGADFKVSGVPAGTITAISLDPRSLRALVTVQVTKPGFGQFHSDANCESRPESLIGEYYVDCNPGASGPVLKAGSTIPVTHTQSTIPADLLQNIMRMPYRERFTIIVNELGAAAAARGGDLQAALQRAVPALTETDALLHLLAGDSRTLQALTHDSNSVITALADNSKNVNRFITEADRTAVATASQQANLRTTLARFPGLLEQLRPTLAQLGTTVTTNEPVLRNLNQASGQLNRLFTDLPAFSRSAQPAIKSLGQASVTGKAAVTAARPTVADLNSFAKPTPELAGNLAIVLQDLDTQKRAVEPDPRSPGGKGFTGLQALLWYVFNQTLAINAYGPLGHMLAVDAFFSPMCSPYATPASIALMLKQYGSAYRQCYSWLGPNQPGVNETDPTDPSAPVPDPGGAPPGEYGPRTSAARLTAAMVEGARVAARRSNSAKTAKPAPKTTTSSPTSPSSSSSTTTTSRSPTSPVPAPPVPGAPPINLKASIGQILAGTVGGAPAPAPPSGSPNGNSASSNQAQQLLNYLLAP
jgi:virulence factor Mce-like protein